MPLRGAASSVEYSTSCCTSTLGQERTSASALDCAAPSPPRASLAAKAGGGGGGGVAWPGRRMVASLVVWLRARRNWSRSPGLRALAAATAGVAAPLEGAAAEEAMLGCRHCSDSRSSVSVTPSSRYLSLWPLSGLKPITLAAYQASSSGQYTSMGAPTSSAPAFGFLRATDSLLATLYLAGCQMAPPHSPSTTSYGVASTPSC